VVNEAIASFDKMIGLDLSEVAVDESLHKAPAGGAGTGLEPDRSGQARLEVVNHDGHVTIATTAFCSSRH
jgi:hypothetical protein